MTKRRPPSLDKIMRDALHRATDAGYDRGQIALAFVHMAEPLSSPPFDPLRESIANACQLQERMIRKGICWASFEELLVERQKLAS